MRKLAFLLVPLAVGAFFLFKPHNQPMQPQTPIKPATAIQQPEQEITSSELLADTNAWRVQNALTPLVENPKLDASAKAKCDDMETLNYWAHNRPDGEEPWVFFKQAKYSYQSAGENLARGYATAEQVVVAWENSPTHNANLLKPGYTEVGFAVCEGPQAHLVVQHLARPL